MEEALHTQHRYILKALPATTDRCDILDLGCGVGESMLFLAKQTNANFCFQGITLSKVQADAGRQYINAAGIQERITMLEGSFQQLPKSLPPIDLAYAIEAFIHSPDADQMLSEVASVLKTGGTIILFDDFLTHKPNDPKEQRIVHDLENGWLALSLLTIEEIKTLAYRHGFRVESERDFSRQLRLYRMRDRFIKLIVPLARLFMRSSQYCRFLVGGDARQRAYQNGLLKYVMLTFTKE